jgi:D-3-phosphoglycerate dehydrogenase
MKNVICIPHLGASTPEAEENCAIFAVRQLKDYLETGNIKNAINFPESSMPLLGKTRIIIANKNIPNMVGQITTVLAKDNINISNMLNQHKDIIAYNIIDVDQHLTPATLADLKKIEGVIMARTIDRV